MPIEEYLGGFHAMIDAHDSVSTFANFGDGVVEWTFQRDKVEVGSGGGFDPPATIHGGAGTLHTGPCKIYESDVKHPGTGERVGWNILSLQNRSLAIPCAPDVPRHLVIHRAPESAAIKPTRSGVFNWHDGLHFFMHGCRDDPMPYIGLQVRAGRFVVEPQSRRPGRQLTGSSGPAERVVRGD